MENYAQQLRAEFLAGDQIRDAGLTTPEDIIRFDNLPYGPLADVQILDLYRPRIREGEDLPVIVNVHGGGLVYGTKETYQFYCMSLAQQGFAVVNYTYRLAPEHPFPAALEDCCQAFQWVLEHADCYHLDRNHIFAVGDSAGGTILGEFCNLCTNPAYAAKLPSCKVPAGFVPQAVALNCGNYVYPDPETAKKDSISFQLYPYIFKNKGTAEEIRLASVAGNVTHAFPPALLMSCQNDFLKMQMVELVCSFIEHDVPFVTLYFCDEKDPLGHVFHCNIRNETARLCNEEELKFFRRFISENPSPDRDAGAAAGM